MNKFLDDVFGVIDTDELESVVEVIERCQGTIYLLGNGASQAIASHMANDLTNMCGYWTRTFTDPVMLTCYTNDFGVSRWMDMALKSVQLRASDCVILISSSGESDNIVLAAEYMNALKMDTPMVTITGFKDRNRLNMMGDVNLWVDSDEYNVVESVHWCWTSAIVEMVRERA